MLDGTISFAVVLLPHGLLVFLLSFFLSSLFFFFCGKRNNSVNKILKFQGSGHCASVNPFVVTRNLSPTVHICAQEIDL